MRVVNVCFIEGRSGAAGDMLVAALLDAGASRDRVLRAMGEASGPGDVEVEVSREVDNDVQASRVWVESKDDRERRLDEVLEFLDTVDLPGGVLGTARGVFERLGKAEEEVHGEAVFHRVGAADAVADVLGASMAYHDLGLGEAHVAVGPISVGGGETVEGYPVPGPAVVNVLMEAGLEWRGGPFETELLTPTGAALLAEMCDSSVRFPPSMVTEAVGIGKGSKELDRPNVVRVFIGESRELSPDEICVLETAVDDATGEEVSYAVDRVLDSGGLDASVLSMGMKKGRTGLLVRVLCRPGDAAELSEVLVRELGTLGVRQYPVEHRHIAEREIGEVDVEVGGAVESVGVKVASVGDEVVDVSAEFDDCAEVA